MSEVVESPPEEVKEKRGFSLVGKLIVGACMGAVVVVECALAYFLIPSAEDVAAVAEARLAQTAQIEDDLVDNTTPEDKGVPEVEVDLGSYSITYKNGASMLHIDVSLAATIKEEDKEDFQKLFDEKQKRFSQLIMFEFRSAEPVDLYANELGLIRRQILEKSNALFGKQMVRQVLISAFSIVEQ